MNRLRMIRSALLVVAATAGWGRPAAGQTLADVEVQEGYVQVNDQVKLHYVTTGQGPLLVMIHGFPDFWYTWRNQMPALSKHFQVVAYDQRGYNLSSQPEGVDEYAVPKLVGDLQAVLDHFQAPRAVVVGHDWGGLVAWMFAMQQPDRIERLIILNLPHPKGLFRELATNPEQQQNSQYARDFQQENAAARMTPERLATWVKDADDRQIYLQAFRRSSIPGMLNYYKAGYPSATQASQNREFPPVKCPVLMFHGLDDKALLPAALNGTWNWIESDLTLITIPGAGHFVQQDAAELVTVRMLNWLKPQLPRP